MNTLEELSLAWRWAQQERKIAPEFVEHHIDNMRDTMNRGLVIVPSITNDCMNTLIPKDKTKSPNFNLYSTGKAICAHHSVKRDLILASSKPNAPIFAAEQLDDNFQGLTRGKREHNRQLSWWGHGKERYEFLADDLGMESEYADSFATVLIPTWDSRIFRIPS